MPAEDIRHPEKQPIVFERRCFITGAIYMEAFDELLSINVPWSQEFSGVLRIWT